jgi:hypothetical protein
MADIDIIRTSSSRPEILKLTTEALHHHLKFSGTFRWIIHEDSVDGRTENTMKYIKENYDVYKQDSPPINQGASLKWLLSQTNTKYVFLIEDDWRLIRDLDVDMMVKILDENNDVNQLTANKRKHLPKRGDTFTKKMVMRSGYYLTTDPYWTLIPSLWRMSYITGKLPPDMEKTSGGACSYGINNYIRRNIYGRYDMCDADWVINNVGTYFIGPIKKQLKQSATEGKMTVEEYDNTDNGFYFQHVGYKPYEPEKWIWPMALPPRERGMNGEHTIYRKHKWEYNGVKWNPTLPVSDNPEYEEWHRP